MENAYITGIEDERWRIFNLLKLMKQSEYDKAVQSDVPKAKSAYLKRAEIIEEVISYLEETP